jgi:hypothetical protein
VAAVRVDNQPEKPTMSEKEPLSPQEALNIIAAEIAHQTALLEQIAKPARWEYLLVIVEAKKERWYEYWANGSKLDEFDNKPVYFMLNALGRQGWEMIGMLPSGDFYFKRRT